MPSLDCSAMDHHYRQEDSVLFGEKPPAFGSDLINISPAVLLSPRAKQSLVPQTSRLLHDSAGGAEERPRKLLVNWGEGTRRRGI